MEQPFPTRDPIEGLRFTFKTDKAAAAANPRTEKESAEFGEPDGRAQLHFGETPLTDPRSLGSSALVHVLLIAVASLTVLNVSITWCQVLPWSRGKASNCAGGWNGRGGSRYSDPSLKPPSPSTSTIHCVWP